MRIGRPHDEFWRLSPFQVQHTFKAAGVWREKGNAGGFVSIVRAIAGRNAKIVKGPADGPA